jgi:hypothetical protein
MDHTGVESSLPKTRCKLSQLDFANFVSYQLRLISRLVISILGNFCLITEMIATALSYLDIYPKRAIQKNPAHLEHQPNQNSLTLFPLKLLPQSPPRRPTPPPTLHLINLRPPPRRIKDRPLRRNICQIELFSCPSALISGPVVKYPSLITTSPLATSTPFNALSKSVYVTKG